MRFDVIIVGAGIIGASTAYHLKQNAPRLKICLIDQNDKVAFGNTAKSAALYRNLFSSRTSQILSTSSITFYKSIAEEISLKDMGYFWMFSKEDWDKSKSGLEKLDPEKDYFEILSAEELPNNLKINTEKSNNFNDIYKILYGHQCGSLSAVKLCRYYSDKFEQLGGKLILNCEIKKINLSGADKNYPPWFDVKILSLTNQNGAELFADSFIFTVGAWSDNLLTPIGIASQIYPKKRQMFALKLNNAKQIVSNPSEKIPIIILPTGGIYIKPILLNKMIMVGCANELGNPYQMDKYPPDAEISYFKNAIEPVLQHYFPKLKNYHLFSKWAGYYAYYWPDKNPVIEKVSNIQWVSGTSGSGIMKADAIGRIAAAKQLELSSIELFDKTKFNVLDLSLKKRDVSTEELII
ncbi:MAG: FAD-binding oxidoreductase [Candidatus Heimdallarchaeota archaeon]|nr:FAD-binding oxidoreductase [Candidatus Heimdallarchaeota archaeon]